jgi:hypothetical protein
MCRAFVFWFHILWLTGMPVLVSGMLQGCRFNPGFADGLQPSSSVMTRRARVQELRETSGIVRRSPFDMPAWYRMLLERRVPGVVPVRQKSRIVRGFW